MLSDYIPWTKAALVGRGQNGRCWVGGGSQGLLVYGDGNPMYNEEKVMEMIKTVGKLCEHFLPQNCKTLCPFHHIKNKTTWCQSSLSLSDQDRTL